MQFSPIPLPRGRHMLGIALICAAAGFAQTPAPKTYDAPPEIVTKLRNRVNEFFQLHTEGSINYRKAFSMVAEDTQDYYFAVQKANYVSFRILTIKFTNPEFTRATVDLEGMQKMQRIEFRGTVVPIPMPTMWKVEDGEWKWYRDVTNDQLTPMGHSDLLNLHPGEKVDPQSLTQLGDPKIVQQMGNKLLTQDSIDKGEIVMFYDKPTSTEVKFHNGQAGEVNLAWTLRYDMEGFKVSADKVNVPAHGEAILKVSYDPPADRLKTGQENLQQIMLLIQPLNESFPIIIRFHNSDEK